MFERAARVAALAGAVVSIGCPPFNQSTNVPTSQPVMPVLEALLLPGPHLRFARRGPHDDGWLALPASSVMLRMASAFPGSDRIQVILTSIGTRASSVLSWVARDDLPGKQRLDAAGFFEVVVDQFGYTILVTPAPAERTGAGFDLIVTNRASNSDTMSAPLKVEVRAAPSRTLPQQVFFDCGEDHDDIAGRWHQNCKNSDSIVASELTLQGWMSGPHSQCLPGLCIEDYHYDFVPDVDFVDEYYGPAGVVASILGSDAALQALAVVGNPRTTGPGLSIADQRPDGTKRGITLNSFVLPINVEDGGSFPRVFIKGELNAWHPNDQGGLFSRHWHGRGTAPAGWTTATVASSDPNAAQTDAWSDTSWPFDPFDPDMLGHPVAAGEYVRVTGPLWQDSAHEGDTPITAQNAPWSFYDIRKGAWLEIHPVDWVERVAATPPVPKTPALFELIDWDNATASKSLTIMPNVPTADRPAGSVLRCRELIDGRLTDMSSVTRHDVVVSDDQVVVTVEVKRTVTPNEQPPQDVPVPVPPYAGVSPGRFKAVYLVWWEQGGAPRTTCASE
jgi:hypothetical protein